MYARDIIAALDSLAPPELAYDWDKCGLATGSPDAKVGKVLVALTPTMDMLRTAKKTRADMIVSHHPLIWDPLTNLRDDNAPAKMALAVAQAGITLYSAHTNVDVVHGGVNTLLADALGLRDQVPLFRTPKAAQRKLVTFVPETHWTQVLDAMAEAGAGVIGEYTHCSFSAPGTGTFKPGENASPHTGQLNQVNKEPELRLEVLVPAVRVNQVLSALKTSHPYEEVAYDIVVLDNSDDTVSLGLIGEIKPSVQLDTFAARTRKALGVNHVRVSGDPKKKIKRVAVMGGAGGGSTPRVPDDVDLYVTGDIKYHEAVDAVERGLAVIDAGHHGTEKRIVPFLADYLKSQCKGLRVTAYMEPDPFRVVTR